MSEKSIISVIVMRDRGKSFSLRFSPNTFKVFLSVLVIIPVLLVASVWFGLLFYGKYVSVLEETVVLKNTIEQNRQIVTRLANLEQFLQKYSPSMLGLLVPSEDVGINSLPVIDGDKDVLMSELATSLAGSSMSFDIVDNENNAVTPQKEQDREQNSVFDGRDTAPDSKENRQTEETAAAGESVRTQKGGEKKPAAAELGKQLQNGEKFVQKIDLGYVQIEGLSAKLTAKTLHISFRLFNVGKKVPIQGVHKYYICSEIDGKVERQELKNPTDIRFRIKRLKNVKSTASVMGMELGKKAQLVVDVVADGEVVYRQFCPITR